MSIFNEELVPLAEAAKSLPRRRAGKKTHVSCLYRWTQLGCRGIFLESIQVGATRCTSMEAMQRFFEALTLQADGPRQPEVRSPRLSAARRKQIEAAEKRLAKAGV